MHVPTPYADTNRRFLSGLRVLGWCAALTVFVGSTLAFTATDAVAQIQSGERVFVEVQLFDDGVETDFLSDDSVVGAGPELTDVGGFTIDFDGTQLRITWTDAFAPTVSAFVVIGSDDRDVVAGSMVTPRSDVVAEVFAGAAEIEFDEGSLTQANGSVVLDVTYEVFDDDGNSDAPVVVVIIEDTDTSDFVGFSASLEDLRERGPEVSGAAGMFVAPVIEAPITADEPAEVDQDFDAFDDGGEGDVGSDGADELAATGASSWAVSLAMTLAALGGVSTVAGRRRAREFIDR